MNISNLMTRDPVCCSPEQSVRGHVRDSRMCEWRTREILARPTGHGKGTAGYAADRSFPSAPWAFVNYGPGRKPSDRYHTSEGRPRWQGARLTGCVCFKEWCPLPR